jgi:uncharacterized protein (TIGR00369 family)
VSLGGRNGHSHCLLCGQSNPSSWRLSFVPDGTGVRAVVPTDASLQGYDGIVHGGVISALLDAAMTHCLFRHGVQALTADLHVRFLSPVRAGESAEVRAWIVADRAPLYRLKAEVTQDREVMAWGEARFLERNGCRRRRRTGTTGPAG